MEGVESGTREETTRAYKRTTRPSRIHTRSRARKGTEKIKKETKERLREEHRMRSVMRKFVCAEYNRHRTKPDDQLFLALYRVAISLHRRTIY